jgi:hypothetical protein
VSRTGEFSENQSATRVRVLAAGGIALIFGVLAWFLGPHAASGPDFGQVWFAAHEFAAGRNPYLATGPGRAFAWPGALFYPITAVALVVPLTWMSLKGAMALFVGLGSGLFAYGLSEDGWARFPVFLSAVALFTTVRGQWSFIIGAGALIPALGFIFAAKPTSSLAAFTYRPSWIAVVGSVALATALTLVWPEWIRFWRDSAAGAVPVFNPWHQRTFALGTFPYYAPVSRLHGLGYLLLLAALRWRRPEARMLFVMALSPVTMLIYEPLLLYLIPRRVTEAAFLAILSWAVWMSPLVLNFPHSNAGVLALSGDVIVALQYFPALAMVLHRSNHGTVPRPIEHLASRIEVWVPCLLRRSPGDSDFIAPIAPMGHGSSQRL